MCGQTFSHSTNSLSPPREQSDKDVFFKLSQQMVVQIAVCGSENEKFTLLVRNEMVL